MGGKGKLRKTKKKRRKQDILADEMAEEDKACNLCRRDMPIYFYGTDEIVKNLAARGLTPLLAELKQDMEAKATYLKYLKVSAKLCQPCQCPIEVHQYCITAKVVRSRKIYCPKCGDAYNVFIKREKACTGKFISLLIKYFLLMLLMIFAAISYLILDAYSKTLYAKFKPGIA